MPQIIGKIDITKIPHFTPKKYLKKSKYVPSECSHAVENARRIKQMARRTS